jgi:hypothetical protein
MGLDAEHPFCMHCKEVWTLEFVAQVTPKSFYGNKYRDRRADLLVDREMAMMPATQVLYEQQRAVKDIHDLYKDRLYDIEVRNKCLERMIEDNKRKRGLIRREKFRKLDGLTRNKKTTDKEVKQFVRECPVEECRGFLSTGLKCGVCKIRACKDCHEVKEEEHTCDPDTVATVKMLSDQTKPCPGCRARIVKVSGCNQVWCTQCKTAFSWTTGKIETGVIHAPDYYDYVRSLNGGRMPRNHLDRPCGGQMPTPWRCNEYVAQYSDLNIDFSDAHRLIGHITHDTLGGMQPATVPMENSDLRIKYLGAELDKKKFRSSLKKIQKKREKEGELHKILTDFVGIVTTYFVNVEAQPAQVDDWWRGMIAQRDRTNAALRSLGYRYSNSHPIISDDWEYFTSTAAKDSHDAAVARRLAHRQKRRL